MKAEEVELKKLCDSAGEFWPDAQGKFICPSCLEIFPIESNEISVEHIIPKAARGKIETFLCKTKCNNRFGEKTAKWLGSYLIHTVEELEKCRPRDQISNRSFTLNGANLSGKIWQSKDGLQIQIPRNRPGSGKKKNPNNPVELEKLDNSDQSTLTLSLVDPVKAFAKKEMYIKIGMLGAAYLLWFKAFGYSWVLQEHLSLIRKMLDEPDGFSPPDGWFSDAKEETISIGFAIHNGAAYPAANIMGKVTVLPSRSKGVPPDNDTPYKMVWLEGGALSTRFSQGAQSPHILMIDLQPVYVPDMLDRPIMEKLYAVNFDTMTGKMSYLENGNS